jgi:hypothetical protein
MRTPGLRAQPHDTRTVAGVMSVISLSAGQAHATHTGVGFYGLKRPYMLRRMIMMAAPAAVTPKLLMMLAR